MAWVRQVRVDSSMSAVCPASLLHCLVHLDVRNIQGIHIKTLHLQVRGINNRTSQYIASDILEVRALP